MIVNPGCLNVIVFNMLTLMAVGKHAAWVKMRYFCEISARPGKTVISWEIRHLHKNQD